jgi:polyisoprenyl-phosphate glycosyltransferase
MKQIVCSIVIPCYNEEKNLGLNLERYAQVINRSNVELVIVNNGSTDGSAAALETLIPKYAFARVITVKDNQGYGYGLLSGLRASQGRFLAWTHADMQTDPADVLTALAVIEQQDNPESVYVKGKRENRPLMDTFFTKSMSLFESFYLGQNLDDINAQPNIFHRSFLDSWQNPPHDFSFDLYSLYEARRQGLKVIRFSVSFPERLHGESNWNTSLGNKWKFIKRTLDYSQKLKRQIKSNEADFAPKK